MYNELIARLILGTTGSAFQKLQLKRADLMTGSKAGVESLVDLLGGQWGKVNLERKYEIVERALFKCTQRQDETNDSYLARSDVVWTELLSKGIDIAEVQRTSFYEDPCWALKIENGWSLKAKLRSPVLWLLKKYPRLSGSWEPLSSMKWLEQRRARARCTNPLH